MLARVIPAGETDYHWAHGWRPQLAVLEAQTVLNLQINADHPFSFLRKVRDWRRELNVQVIMSNLLRFIIWHGTTRKKWLSTQPSRPGQM